MLTRMQSRHGSPYARCCPARDVRRCVPHLAHASSFASGWFWYLGMLVPVIGLVQVGGQARADRYTYLPLVGLFWILAWTAEDLENPPALETRHMGRCSPACLACGIQAWTQAGYWRNGATLFQRAVDVTEDNGWARYKLSKAHYTMANNLVTSGHHAESIDHFEEALRVRPNYPEAENNLAIQLANMPGRTADAIAHFEAALRLDPNLAQAHRNLGMLLASIAGRAPEAIVHLEAAQRLQPDPQLQQMIQRLR